MGLDEGEAVRVRTRDGRATHPAVRRAHPDHEAFPSHRVRGFPPTMNDQKTGKHARRGDVNRISGPYARGRWQTPQSRHFAFGGLLGGRRDPRTTAGRGASTTGPRSMSPATGSRCSTSPSASPTRSAPPAGPSNATTSCCGTRPGNRSPPRPSSSCGSGAGSGSTTRWQQYGVAALVLSLPFFDSSSCSTGQPPPSCPPASGWSIPSHIRRSIPCGPSGRAGGRSSPRLAVHEVGDPSPARRLLVGVQPGAAGRDPPRRGDADHLGHHQPGAAERLAAQVDEVEVAGHAVRRRSTCPSARRRPG